ncbi:MAG: imidazoleglycerol-phosphate dehydratase HisB [Thermoguttaceae bacterium]|nr:imidazoleglycerol-phosphate dehydratase HisB [Thermoguttaceae bacterium]MBQ2557298.1 imidazoleglycerol-phosphate dehydratase HisB [Thermoguttaceae bacterium]
MRTAKIERKTKETQIQLEINLDGTGRSSVKTGLGFFDHMLTLFSAHSKVDLKLTVHGDLDVDGHHTVEDVGIALGKAFADALGDKKGIRRYGFFVLPMDETLAETAVDFSGRPFLVFNASFPVERVGSFDLELVNEFWQGFANSAACNLHINVPYGGNGHHISEAIFKSTARSIRAAVENDPREKGVPSTKGSL